MILRMRFARAPLAFASVLRLPGLVPCLLALFVFVFGGRPARAEDASEPFIIYFQPASVTATEGDNAALQVFAFGESLSFQWYEGDRGDTSHPVAGATGSLLLARATPAARSFWVRVSDSQETENSLAATVTALPRTGWELKGMGSSYHGQLGIGVSRLHPARIETLTDVAQIAAAYGYSLFLKTDGSLWAMGDSPVEEDGVSSPHPTPVNIASDVAQIAAGGAHVLFVKTDGSLWSVGRNRSGQLGDGSYEYRKDPVQVATDVAQVAAGGDHSLFIKTDGSLWAMGYNGSGQLGDGSYDSRATPVRIASDVVRISAGAYHSLFVKTDGSLWAMGADGSSLSNDGSFAPHNRPVQIAADVAQAAAGSGHSLFIKTDGSLWAMGYNSYGQLGDGTTLTRATPVQIAAGVVRIAAGYGYSLFAKTDGSLWAMGYNSSGQLGDGSYIPYSTTPVQMASEVDRIAAGSYHSLFIKTDGSLWGVGDGYYGQLGDISTDRTTPVSIASDVIGASAGDYHSLFAKADGSLWAMGDNEYGQLGDGSLHARSTPVQVAFDVILSAAGSGHSLYVKTDGSLWAMGDNRQGQLGDGSLVSRSTPVPIASDVVQAAAGSHHSLFLKTDGSLWAMGANNFGQLGDGTYDQRTTPVQIAANVVQVAAGAFYSLFLKTDGSLWTMGANNFGTFGGSPSPRNTPVMIATGVTQVEAGAAHALYLASGGLLYAMGNGEYGQLGLGSYVSSDYPVQVSPDVTGLAAGPYHSLFIKADASLWAMGQGESGQLGDGGSGDHTVNQPVQIAANALYPTAGSQHSLFLTGSLHTVTFDLGTLGFRSGGGPLVQRVRDGASAVPPSVNGYFGEGEFRAWDTTFDQVTGDLTVHALYRRAQEISFDVPASLKLDSLDDRTLVLSASASSGLPVTIQVLSGPATLGADGHTLTFSDAGDVLLYAFQPGNDDWMPALYAYRRILVKGSGKAQKITFPQPASQTYGGDPLPLGASASSALPIVYEVVSGYAYLSSETTLVFYRPGRVVVRASQPGGMGFAAAPDVTRTLVVHKAPLTVTVENAERAIGEANPDFSLSYSGFVGWDAGNPAHAIADLDQPPIARTKANRKSPPGDYPITISGGSDDLYEFRSAKPAGILSVHGFGGTYETLLSGSAGKLTITIPPDGLSYTGVLRLAREARPIVISSTSRAEGTTPLIPQGISSASATWTRAASGDKSVSLSFTVYDDGWFEGHLDFGAHPFYAYFIVGGRLRTTGAGSSWSGRHTLRLPPSESGHPWFRPYGSGHAAISMAPRTGALTITGKLADGSPLTASLRPDETDMCYLWTNPYGSRTYSYLEGWLHPNPEWREALTWKKAALPESTPEAKLDKIYPYGFGDLRIVYSLDPWLPPVTKATAARPAVTLAQRLGLAASGEFALFHDAAVQDLGARAAALPISATLSAAGKITVGLPNATDWKIRSLNPTTGAFSGSFVLVDPTPTETNPGKITKRPVAFSGTLRQPPAGDPDGDLIGTGFFLLPPLPDSNFWTDDEWSSNELRFVIPAP